ncbi:hypothetical protein [Frigidibacter sp. SD6-1]|uniref:hypothetical protein n=1 Tax=Frigidibacter sp. SD6-1 TaxID=3032581 RepID=UPI0024DF5EAA|nr:hypothetical protein [Frigidibacter sp. SD6-1]
MKRVFAAAAIATLFAATPASAGIPYGYYEFGEMVSELPAEAADLFGQQATLCHLVRKYHIAYIPLFFRSEGYVIAANHCAAASYVPLTADRFAALQAMGIVPKSLPAVPSLSLGQRSPPVAIGLLVAAFVMVVASAKRRQRRRVADLGDLPDATKALLDMLAHAATACGVPRTEAAPLIAVLATHFSTTPVQAQEVQRGADIALARSLPKPRPVDISMLARAVPTAHRQAAMEALMTLVETQGALPPSALPFLRHLSAQLKADAGLAKRRAYANVSPGGPLHGLIRPAKDHDPRPTGSHDEPPRAAPTATASAPEPTVSAGFHTVAEPLPPGTRVAFEIMCRAALKNGLPGPSEVEAIQAMSQLLLRMPLDPTFLARMIAAAANLPDPPDFALLLAGLSAPEKEKHVRMALLVASSRGNTSPAAAAFVAQLARAAGLDDARLRALYAELEEA